MNFFNAYDLHSAEITVKEGKLNKNIEITDKNEGKNGVRLQRSLWISLWRLRFFFSILWSFKSEKGYSNIQITVFYHKMG